MSAACGSPLPPLCLSACFTLCLAGMRPVTAQTELASPHEQKYGYFGSSVSAIPDLDGDNIRDLAVGAPQEDVHFAPWWGVGRVYIFAGSTGALLRQLTSSRPESSGYFGSAVAGLMDVDGDGAGDLLVGAPQEENGRAYLFSGASGTLLRVLESPYPNPPGTANHSFGCAVAGLEDINEDGRGDLVIGAQADGLADSELVSGRVYVFSGADGTLLFTLWSPNPCWAGGFGHSVAAMPDTDGDGLNDLAVGAYLENDEPHSHAGHVYIFSTATGTQLAQLDSPYPVDYGEFGNSVSGVSDVNGDDRGDVLIGAPNESLPGHLYGTGLAYVFSGATGQVLSVLTSPDEQYCGHFGGPVCGAPDLDGDGRGEALVGPYVYSGAVGDLLMTLLSPNPQPDGRFGAAVSVIPATVDRPAWLALGAPSESPGTSPSYAGRTYLFPFVWLPDADRDGVPDEVDDCPNTVHGSPVDAVGCPPSIPGDFDRDGDVDQSDFGAFESCASGPGISRSAGCENRDLDNDGDADQADFAAVQRCYSGEDVPANPNCAN